jgi:CubicO group peptidase (beta-lactamase class C family)
MSHAISSFGITFLFCTAALGAEISDSIKKAVQDRVDGGKTMGMVIGVVDADGAKYFGYGKMAASGNETPGKDSVFEIGSISKVFTAILLADAVNRGEVNYDDTIESHLPDGVGAPTRDGKSITLEHLSVQNSGLPRMPNNFRPADPTNPYADYSFDQLYEFLGNVELARDIGEKYEYSNLGVGLLGHMLERATDQSYEELVVSRISQVLGMPDTAITLSEDMRARLAIGHQGEQAVANWDLPTFAGAGALRSTAQDMIIFLEANMGLRESPLLEAMKETHRSRARAGGIVMDIGLGWHIRKMAKGQNVIWHNGGTGGYRTFAGFVQDPPMGVVVLTNSTGAGDDDIGLHMLNEAVPMAAFTPRDVVKVADSILEKYVGKYELVPGVRFDVRLRDHQLRVQLTGQQRIEVFAESDTKFFYKVVDAQLTFNVDDDGNVASLTLHQNGRNQEAKKME